MKFGNWSTMKSKGEGRNYVIETFHEVRKTALCEILPTAQIWSQFQKPGKDKETIGVNRAETDIKLFILCKDVQS